MQGQRPEGINGKKVVYLSFDDGPSITVTPKILDILKEENVKATFFLVGKAVEENEVTKKITKRLIREGHAIGNHTYSHDYGYFKASIGAGLFDKGDSISGRSYDMAEKRSQWYGSAGQSFT
nr:polysaccharide deacetylase family protein [Paenibacillus ottowii]